MTTRAVLFDIDGTLIDTVDLHAKAWLRAFGHFGIETDLGAVRGQIGKGGDHLMPVFVPPDRLDAIKDDLERFRKDLFAREYMPRVRPFPSVRPLFERCRAGGLTVALATSSHEEEARRYAKIAGIDDLVDAMTTSSDAEHSKPDPDIFTAALARCAPARAAEAVVVGDTPYDGEAARRAGIRFVGVLCGGFPEAELREAGAVAIYRDPADVLARFDDSPLAE